MLSQLKTKDEQISHLNITLTTKADALHVPPDNLYRISLLETEQKALNEKLQSLTHQNQHLTSIISNNETTNQEIKYAGDYTFSKAVFQTNTEHIYVSSGFMDFLYLHIFGELIDKEVCVFVYGDSETQELTCGCSELDPFPNFVFNINGISFRFNGIDLFSKRGALCYFVIKEKGSNNPDKEGVVIGSKFYDKYYTEFDYDNNKIHFSSKTAFNMNDSKPTNTNIKLILLIIIIVTNIANLIYYYIVNQINT